MSPSPPPPVDGRARPVCLGERLAAGGEGVIYALADHPATVAKVYHRPADEERAAKLAAMVATRSERLAALAVWPTDLLYARPGGPIVGLLMPRVEGHAPVYELYGPRSRRTRFPQATWQFLVHAAANVARALAAVHEHGHVVGDINHSGVLVSQQSTVALIDCDSFQIRDGDRLYPCTVGVPEFTPPELHGRALAGVARTPDHDAFGLAVLIFQILFLGRHPYVGAYAGGGEMPIGQAIAEHRYAYGARAAAQRMTRPPGTLPPGAIAPSLAPLFEAAFSPNAARAGRPSAAAWVTALTALSGHLLECAADAGHHFAAGLPTCPWCLLERQTGVRYFPSRPRGRPRPDDSFVLDVAWRRALAVTSPGPAPSPPSAAVVAASPALVELGRSYRRRRRLRAAATAGVAVLGVATLAAFLILATAPPGVLPLAALVLTLLALLTIGTGLAVLRGPARWRLPADPLIAARRELAAAQERWVQMSARWWSEAGETAFLERRRALQSARSAYLALDDERATLVRRARIEQAGRQRRRFLESQRIAQATIPGLGPARVATLLSYGVETAADLEAPALAKVPGIGPVLIDNLLAWRGRLERGFRFQPGQTLGPAEQAVIDGQIGARRRRLERELAGGAAALERLHAQALSTRARLEPELAAARQALDLAEAVSRALR